MKAIRVHQTGGPEVMKFEDLPAQEPAEGQVRIKIEAAGVNFTDIAFCRGDRAAGLPFTPGLEAAGVVEAVGPGVTELAVGDRVAYALQLGAYAEQAVVPLHRVVKVPAGVELSSAAAVMLQGMTAHYLSENSYPIQAGDTVLVHAAAGGVGLLLVQMAKRKGATVIGTVSTEEKVQAARAAGADHVIRYDQADFEAEVKNFAGGKGIQAVYDSVGKETFQSSLNVLAPRGTLAVYGSSSGPVPPFSVHSLNSGGSLFLTSPSLGHHAADAASLQARATDLFDWLGSGELKVRIGMSLPLSEAPEAHRALAGRKTIGKVLLTP